MKKLIVMIASLVLVASFALTAAADDQWDFYGSARVSTFLSQDNTDNVVFAEALQGNARIGANVKVSDELSGRFEYGSGPNLRLLYGSWNFGGGSLLVGQTYTPLNLFYSNQVYGADTGLLNTGGVYSGRAPMLQLSVQGFKIAFIVPVTPPAGAGTSDAPTIEVSYGTKLGAASVKLAAGYDVEGNGDDEAYVIAGGLGLNFGAISIKGDIYAGQFAENLIWTAGTGDNNVGYLFAAGFKVNDMFSLEAGYGSADGDGVADAQYAYYLQAPITLAGGVYLVPEIGAVDNGDTKYGGAKWQINF